MAAGAPMHQHFRDVGAVRLVRGLVERELDGTAKAPRIFSNEQRAFARSHLTRHAAPEGHGMVAGERVHEAYRGAAFDAVDQDADELLNLGIGERVEAPWGPAKKGHRG
ncbi:hypothetical protein SBV1_2210004 [Verrucomicrobia bacterium]|nr:hypothetical protein SBV1_2210004 [Verrucomicrobiota bacterium]